jgi:preprotein translocase subunit SecA
MNWMGPIYDFLGPSTGSIQHDASFVYQPKIIDSNEVSVEMKNLRPVSRREAYAVDITYGTNNEFGFDYLRDNMVQSAEQMVQRELNYAIVDEVDSILIDEARTPLIISAPDTESTKLYRQFAQVVPRLRTTEDYTVDEKMRAVSLTDKGISAVEKMLGVDNIYDVSKISYVHQLEHQTNILFKRDRDYVVQTAGGDCGRFHGRLMPGIVFRVFIRRSRPKKTSKESRTLRQLHSKLLSNVREAGGMTERRSRPEEFAKATSDVVPIPTNQP